MARDFQIDGECLASVRLGAHISVSGSLSGIAEFGLTQKEVIVLPTFYHADLIVDDFGPNVPPELLWMIAEVRIFMTIIHYDESLFDQLMNEAMCGSADGTLVGAGAPMGANKVLYASGNHLVGLSLTSPVLGKPWLFPATYITGQPLEIPMGTRRKVLRINWRAIPYTTPPGQSVLVTSGSQAASSGNTPSFGLASSGVQLWKRSLVF